MAEQQQQAPQPNLQPMTAPTTSQSLMMLRQKMQEMQGTAQQQAPQASDDLFAPQKPAMADDAGALAAKKDDNAAFLQESGVMAEQPKGYDSDKIKHYVMNLEKDPAFHEATQEGGWWTKVETLRGLIQQGHASPQEAINALMETEPELMAIADKHHPKGGDTHHRSMLTHPDLHDQPRLLAKAQAANLGGVE